MVSAVVTWDASPKPVSVCVVTWCLLCVCMSPESLVVDVCDVLCGHGGLQAAAALPQLARVAVEGHLQC